MKVAVIGTVGVPANYGGFETLVEQLILNKKKSDFQYTIFCSSKSYSERLSEFEGASLKYIGLNANGMQSIPYDVISLIKATKEHDVILILGVSGCAFLPIYRLFSKKKLIINIDGLEHKRDKWNKWVRLFLKFSESMAVKYGDVIIADNKGIADYVEDEYGKTAELIAYGGDHVIRNISDEKKKSILNEFGLKANGYSMALCRIEPENNVELILESYSRMPDKKLIFIGNWEKNGFGREMKEKYSSYPNIKIQSPIFDLEILNALRGNCNLYLHGHSAGGTNPSLIEAMFFKKPIMAYDCIYNRESTENRAIYFKDAEDLCNKILSESEDLDSIGAAMYEIASARYRWEVVAGQYESLF